MESKLINLRKWHKFSLIILSFLVYSCTGIFSKLASQHAFLSIPYILYFGCVVGTLGLYAVLWQKVLSFMPLNKAFLCKSICIVFTLCISYWMFAETITLNNIFGAIIIILGLIVLAWKK